MLSSLFFCSILTLAPFIQGQDIPTLYPVDSFNPSQDASTLRNSFNGLGTDEQAAINVLCKRVAAQRDTIDATYNTMYSKTLVEDLKSELSGAFRSLMIMLTYATHEFLAIELHDTMAGAGTDEESLTEMLMSRSNQELADTRNFYLIYYGKSMIADIMSETVGSEQDLLVLMANGNRDESLAVDNELVSQDVDSLYAAGQEIPDATDEAVFVNIFGSRSYPHLSAVNDLYLARYNFPLETVIDTEFVPASSIHGTLLSILEYSRSKEKYFASRFFSSIHGSGTDEHLLTRLTISRCEIDLQNIKNTYQSIFGHSLASDVSSDTAGDFQRALLTLIA